MNAIVPLNIAALRVNNYDGTVVGNFQGKTAVFDKMPWNDPKQTYPNSASTGDKIYHTLNVTPAGVPQFGPNPPLGTGIHLHWELPNFFRKGTQATQGAPITFPHAPNRWLVTRYLSVYNQSSQQYENRAAMSWIVESDYVSQDLPDDLRPVISVPLPSAPAWKQQPFMYMGQVVELGQWNPNNEPASSYLPYYKGTNGQQLYLTSIGFVGAYFGSYYPECNSVFGFWDSFSDQGDVFTAISNGSPVQFRASYQVIGWLNEAASDPLANIVTDVTQQYNDYVARCTANNTPPVLTPIDFFNQLTTQNMKWSFNQQDLSYTLNNGKIATLNVPTLTVCAGTTQEVVWNMLNTSGPTYFLKSSGNNPSVWDAKTEIAIGNSTEEALAALLKYDMGQNTDDPNVLDNYEFLLDALQLGLLKNLEKTPNKLISLEEALHSNGFSSLDGGYVWMITDNSGSDAGDQAQEEVTLPLDLAEKLFLLNQAQKNYDMGRGGLSTMRRQLFMDWIRYVKIFVNETPDPNISTNTMNNFIWTSSGGELNAVINQGNAVGVLLYDRDDSGAITGILQPTSNVATTSLAYLVYNAFEDVQNALAAFNSQNKGSNWILQCGSAPSFYMPSEPVVLMEGEMMEPPQRNGDGTMTFVRLSGETLSQLNIAYNGANFSVNVSSLSGVPAVTANMPAALQADIQALTDEAFLITPMLAGIVETALAAAGGANNPAVASPGSFTTALMYAQGGLSPLDLAPNAGGIPAPTATGLFETIRTGNYKPAANNSVTITGPQALQITFTNTQNNGWAPDSIAWNTQTAYPEFTNTRVDPFMPIFMIWSVNLNPLQWEQDKINQVYSPTNITDFFSLDADGVDYKYNMNGNTAVPFTAASVAYGQPATMRSGASGVLSFQITSYLNNNPDDPEKQTLQDIANLYGSRKILSQALSGFNINQVLADYVAQLAVENLVSGPKDNITFKLATAAKATLNDSWYDQAFNNVEPISTGPLAQGNFGPLRAGFMQITSIEVVDVFGQRMDLYTPGSQPGQQPLKCITSYAMSPQLNDTANAGSIFLAPRILTPTRLWFRWLSATHNNDVAGVSTDFVEMNSHPATSPVCGWVMPNHLDNNLFFYDANGNPIGTFGVEHTGANAVNKYRTRAGNLNNPTSDLAMDIGPLGSPLVNLHLANYMWYLSAQSADYLKALMKTIEDSDTFITPSNSAQDAALAVFIGRPLALTRAVVGLETMGNLLPLSQADNNANSPFPQDVNAQPQRVNYTDRMQYSSANLGGVKFPMRLGDLANLDDGLIGYLMEGTGQNPYTGQTFYAPAAPGGITGIQAPTDTTIQLNLNATPIPITMLVDPRAPVHATTGVLGVNELSIPTDQYSQTMGSLAVNFVTRPMLQMAQGLAVPLPQESGYAWSWITPGASSTTPLKSNAVDQSAAYGYTPQTIQEGWLQLSPDTTASKQKSS
jgi:hypothetical protein